MSEKDKFSRRHFIAGSGTGLIAAGLGLTLGKNAAAASSAGPATKLPPAVPLPLLNAPTDRESKEAPTQLAPDRRWGFAIVGLGRLSFDQILPAFGRSKWCRPVALVSGDPDKARKVAEQYGIPPTGIYGYKNYDDMKNNPAIDIVYIVLPNGLHAEYTIRAFKAGKHVLCEKPMANSVHECEQMIDAGRAAGKKLMVAYRIQYEPHHLAVRDMIHGKELGHIKLIQLDCGQNQGDPKQWRLNKALAGGGALPDVGVYCLNTARFLMGEEPVEVSARVHSSPGDPRFKEVEESVFWSMRFPSGTSALCSTELRLPRHETLPRVRIRGVGGRGPRVSVRRIAQFGSAAARARTAMPIPWKS